MQVTETHLIVVLLLGLVGGWLFTWVIGRGKLALAEATSRAAGEVERTALSEQLKSAVHISEQSRQRALLLEESTNTLRASLDAATAERAQFAERAGRIPELEAVLRKNVSDVEAFTQQIASLREQNAKLTTQTDALQQQITRLDQTLVQNSGERDGLSRDLTTSKTLVAKLSQELQTERTHSQEKLALLEQAKEALSDQFKALAGEILDEKSKKFTEQNQTNLGQLLNPLKQQLTDFKSKVEEVYINEGKDRSALTEQVKQLMALNQTLSHDANNLALAIKGDRKTQGTWGEIILDDVLEKAGLLRGQHYERQGSVKTDDGQTHVIPDVVINLPGGRHLVVDSKFTLPDYRAFASAESDEERAAALKRHLTAIRNHMKGLSEKNYQALYGLKSLDFVVMFIPLEPAFMIAVTNDRELFQQAWEKNVLLVSPSTLLFVVRTVAYLWRQEGLSRNAKEISNRGAELYDKLVSFVVDLQKVGDRIQQAQDSYQEARKKFCEGSGNVIRQAEMLKKLGVKPSKALPAAWVETSMDEPLAALSDASN